MNRNPFEDPSVTRLSSPAPPPPLDPSRLAPPSPAVTPMGVTPQYNQPMNASMKSNHQNLMDEIGNSIKATNSTTIMRVMRTINLILAISTIVAGLLAWIMGYVYTFQKVIAGIYIIMFGVLLLMFELRTEKIDVVLRANFGFMYDNRTRTAFLLFIAIWPLSMGNFWLTILDAVLLFVNAFFNYYVISQHPGFSQNPVVYDVGEAQGNNNAGYNNTGYNNAGYNNNGYNNNGYVPTEQI